jgi:hypothetical protein
VNDDFENPLLKVEGTNFSSRLKLAVYWVLWAVVMAAIIGSSVGAILWMLTVYGGHGFQ